MSAIFGSVLSVCLDWLCDTFAALWATVSAIFLIDFTLVTSIPVLYPLFSFITIYLSLADSYRGMSTPCISSPSLVDMAIVSPTEILCLYSVSAPFPLYEPLDNIFQESP